MKGAAPYDASRNSQKEGIKEKGCEMKDIKVEVTFTEGYEDRFTKACMETLEKRELPNIDERMKIDKKKQKVTENIGVA